jgi:hypothetical protein
MDGVRGECGPLEGAALGQAGGRVRAQQVLDGRVRGVGVLAQCGGLVGVFGERGAGVGEGDGGCLVRGEEQQGEGRGECLVVGEVGGEPRVGEPGGDAVLARADAQAVDVGVPVGADVAGDTVGVVESGVAGDVVRGGKAVAEAGQERCVVLGQAGPGAHDL